MQPTTSSALGGGPVNYYAFHIGDYAVHTRHLSHMEDLAYRRLLDWYYTNEKPITGDPTEAAGEIGMHDFVAEVTRVLKKFFILEGEAWINPRAEEEIAKCQAISERARSHGKAGGRPSASKKPINPNPGETQPVISGNPGETQPPVRANPENPTGQAPITHYPLPITPTVKKSAFAPESAELPECVPREAWIAWIEYRRTRRLSTTEPTVKLQLRKLAEWHAIGHDPASILETSISNGWQGLFEPKVRPQARADRHAAFWAGATNTGDNDARHSGTVIDAESRVVG